MYFMCFVSIIISMLLNKKYIQQQEMRNQAETFEIAQNQQKLSYYSYIRETLQAKQIAYWIGNPSVQIINGTIYLRPSENMDTNKQLDNFQEYLKQYNKANSHNNNKKNSAKEMKQQNKQSVKQMQGSVQKCLVLVGIPNSKCPIQVCDRLSPYLDWISQIRVIKTNHFKYYSLLMLFKDNVRASKFYHQIFGEQYNSLQIQRILLRQMTAFSCVHTDRLKMNNQQLLQHRKRSNVGNQQSLQRRDAQQIFLSSSKPSPSILILPSSSIKKQTATPLNNQQSQKVTTCAICFEQGQGPLISILCSHYFHVKCLSQWKQNICPLCRYSQHPMSIKFCQKCNQCQGLWVCLVCGVRLCCGFDHNILGSDSHIYQHYLQTDHKLSMDVQTKFIFDASQPAFLHQMLYKQVLKNNQGAFESQVQSQYLNKKGKKSKLSDKISEYEQSISEQMHKQRMYFEQNISKQVKLRKDKIKQTKKKIQQSQIQLQELDKQLQQAEAKRQQLQVTTANLQKQVKVIENVKNYWQVLVNKQKVQIKQKSDDQMRELKKIDQLIAAKKQELKDIKKNIQISQKIKVNIGKDQVQNAFVLGTGLKENKKKKK